MQQPLVSVIIPCYNQGQYIDEAVDSVLAQTYQNLEIIIVNDGSTDELSIEILGNYKKTKTTVLHTANKGLPSARNYAIKMSKGKYILPLDADDKIGSTYMEKAVNLLEANTNLGVVYCKAEFFGDQTGKWDLPEYKFPDILLVNVIFCCGFFRKDDWEKVGGYNHEMIYGWEDYDFWLSIIELGREVQCIPNVLFYYRRKSDSMVEFIKGQREVYCYSTIFKKHHNLYFQNIEIIFSNLVFLRSELERSQSLLHHTQSELERSQSHLQHTQSELERSQAELDRSQSVIAGIKASKFWKLRNYWFAFKKIAGVKIDD